MSLTEIVSNMDLDIYPIIAMILFLVAFGIIAYRVMVCPKGLSRHQAMMALDDGDTEEMIGNRAKGDARG